MTAIGALVTYLFLVGFSVASAKGALSPVRLTERGSGALVFLETHPRAGTQHSRARLRHRAKAKVWYGLRLAGVAWLDRRRGDVDARSPFGCIHQHEGNWDDADDPHWGGLQMDRGFQGTYGSEYIRVFRGLANVWPIWAQVVAGYRAHHGYHGYGARGFGPWSTAGMCGL